MSEKVLNQTLDELKGLKSEVQKIKTEQQEMKPLVEQIPAIKQAVTETSQDVKTLMTSQAKQDKILERLSVRSIEHEADIAEIRRAK